MPAAAQSGAGDLRQHGQTPAAHPADPPTDARASSRSGQRIGPLARIIPMKALVNILAARVGLDFWFDYLSN